MQSDINFLITYDPTKDGNCQFSALCDELANIGIFRSAETLRKDRLIPGVTFKLSRWHSYGIVHWHTLGPISAINGTR